MSESQNIADIIETRRRSRSTTPGLNLRVSSDRELNGAETTPSRKVRKTPAVGIIAEEEQTSSAQKTIAASQGRSTPVRKARVVTSDYSSEEISPERVRQAAAAVVASANAQLAKANTQLTQSSVTTTTMTISSEQTTIILDGGKEKISTVQVTQSSTNSGGNEKEKTSKTTVSTSPKKDAGSLKSVQQVQDEFRSSNVATTRSARTAGISGTSVIRTSTPKNAVQHSVTAKVALSPEELQQHAAYKEYLEAGEYWNKYPKTDYTYSELSPHRREVAPGLVAMPNMSRPSLNKHAERVQMMIQRSPEQEKYIRERYTSARTKLADPYDSSDEIDHLLSGTKGNLRRQTVTIEQRSIVSRFFLSIVTFCFTCVDTVRQGFRRREEQHMYYTRIEDERGFFARAYTLVSSFFINVFKRIYLLISSVLFLDAWLLQTSVVEGQQQRVGQRKRRFLLFLLGLLPFLLIGAYLLADEDQTIKFPSSSRATLALSSISRMLPTNLKDADVDVESFYRYVSEHNSNLRARLQSATSLLSPAPLFGWLTTISWPWLWSWQSKGYSKSETATRETIRETLQRTLSREEFEELMKHIDAYIDEVMEHKYASKAEAERLKMVPEDAGKQTITPEMTVHVAQVLQESLKTYNYHLTDSDVEKVAEKVRISLQASYPQLFVDRSTQSTTEGGKVELAKEYIAEIQRLVEQQITVHNNHFVIAGPQLEDLLERILSSERLSALMDERIAANRVVESKSRTEADRLQREALVDDLQKELNDIKTHFSEQLLSSSVQWEERLKMVTQNYEQLEEQLHAYRLESNDLYQKLLADIDVRLAALREERFEGVNRVIRENIITILGLNVKQDIADGDLRAWISGLFVARDHLEQRLEEIQTKVHVNVREEIEQSASRLMKEIGEQIRVEMMLRLEEAQQAQFAASHTTVTPESSSGDGDVPVTTTTSNLTEDDVKRIVRDALMVYDADKTGMVDYALESAGGQVLSTRCTENYQVNSAEFRIFGIIPIWYPSNTPRTVISPTMEPGQCWAFQGFPGYLVIQLNTEIIVTGFTLEHISKLLVSKGSISSAPKHFTVWGLLEQNDPEPVLLGSYEYLDKMGSSIQYFRVQNQEWKDPLKIVELRIESNHGNIHYTCLYRFRVHGEKV